MPQLQELIIRLGCATLGDVNRAIFAHPESGLLDALEQSQGIEHVELIREQLSQATNIPILPEKEIRIDDEALNVNALELSALVTKYFSLPLRLETEGDGQCVILAMSDPLNESAKSAFSQLYQMPVKAYFARERVVMDAYALAHARLALRARSEAIDHREGSDPSISKHLEDPEVRRALQQVVATAVKHSASEVLIDLSHPFTRAHFTFGDGLKSSVDISVSPVSFLSSLIRRGQILEECEGELLGACRIRFKSVSVNFSFTFRRDVSFDGSDIEDLKKCKLNLREFLLDQPDNPAFWRSLSVGSGMALHELLQETSGVFVICGAKQSARDFAIRSFVESYPDLLVVEGSNQILESLDAFQLAENRRIALNMGCRDVFDVLQQLAELPSELLSLVKGVVGYLQMPRNCCFCSQPAVPETSMLLQVPAFMAFGSKEFREGKGCVVCNQKGFLGFVGLSSLVSMSGYAGQLLRKKGNFSAILQALAKDSFVSLYEEAVTAAASGKTKLAFVVEEVPRFPEAYEQARLGDQTGNVDSAERDIETVSVLALQEQDEDDLTLEAEDAPPRKTSASVRDDQPIRGRDVFLSMRGGRTPPASPSNEHETDWLIPKSEPEDLAKPEKNTRKRSTADRSLLLVIDDDADQRAILRRVFEIAGYDVEVAADGIDGIVSAVRLEPELIIVDFMMPELDGRETIRRLKQGTTTGPIPIVALTAYADPDVELGLLQAGADDFCPKSVSKQVLLKRVERLIRNRA